MKSLAKKIDHVFRWKYRHVRHRYLDRYIFIHINKTGGSSVERALKLPLEHKTALEKIQEIGQSQWDRRFTFAVVRNPWDKVVSHYHYRVQTNQTGLGAKPVDFQQWVRLAYGEQDPAYYNHPKMFMPQSDWITDQRGKIIVDEVCRFENLNADFGRVCEKLGIRNVTLPHTKSSKRGHYSDYYDDEAAQIVRRCFEKDIDHFGYALAGPAAGG